MATRTHVKLLEQINVPFAASVVLNEDYAEVLLCIFFGSAGGMPQAAINVCLRYPYANERSSSLFDAELNQLAGNASSLLFKQDPSAQLLEKLAPPSFLHEPLGAPSNADPQVAGPSGVGKTASTDEEDTTFLSLIPSGTDEDDKLAAAALLEAANEGVAMRAPELVAEGEGGTYFVYDETGDVVGVFKPTDEDPQGDNNPKKKRSLSEADACPQPEQRTRESIPANETAVREAAAYAIDKGYAGVPPTFLVRARHSSFGNASEAKLGSLQQFAVNECASWDVGPASFSVSDVHRIGMFDIRTFNTDRHGGNLLCRKTDHPQGKVQYDLVPIDHAYCFPTALGEANWEWLYWPQAKVPFTEEELRYIESIDVEADVALLASMGLSQEALRVHRITSTFLKKGAAAGLTLFEMGKLCYRGRNDSVSQLEAACAALDPEDHPGDSAEASARYIERLARALEELCQSCRQATINCNNRAEPQQHEGVNERTPRVVVTKEQMSGVRRELS